MRSATLTRPKLGTSDTQGTFGNLLADNNFSCRTLELPDRGNVQNRSCIPEGIYVCRWSWSEKHGKNLYHLLKVPGRTVVELHAFNLAGDVSVGYVAESLGCIGVGKGAATFPPLVAPAGKLPQLGITNSASALAGLEDAFDSNGTQVDFMLTIRRAA